MYESQKATVNNELQVQYTGPIGSRYDIEVVVNNKTHILASSCTGSEANFLEAENKAKELFGPEAQLLY